MAIVITEYVVWPTITTDSTYDIAFEIGNPLHYLGTAIFGIVSGILADRVGRKLPNIIGLIILAFSFILMGSSLNEYTVFAHLMAIGIAFGFLMVLSIAVPGDLAFPHSKERFYALILVLPLTIYGGLGAIPSVFGYTAHANIVSPILSAILFIAVLPVYMAEETLPKEEIRRRKLKEHLKKVKKLVEEEETLDQE